MTMHMRELCVTMPLRRCLPKFYTISLTKSCVHWNRVRTRSQNGPVRSMEKKDTPSSTMLSALIKDCFPRMLLKRPNSSASLSKLCLCATVTYARISRWALVHNTGTFRTHRPSMSGMKLFFKIRIDFILSESSLKSVVIIIIVIIIIVVVVNIIILTNFNTRRLW